MEGGNSGFGVHIGEGHVHLIFVAGGDVAYAADGIEEAVKLCGGDAAGEACIAAVAVIVAVAADVGAFDVAAGLGNGLLQSGNKAFKFEGFHGKIYGAYQFSSACGGVFLKFVAGGIVGIHKFFGVCGFRLKITRAGGE